MVEVVGLVSWLRVKRGKVLEGGGKGEMGGGLFGLGLGLAWVAYPQDHRWHRYEG